MDKKIVHQFQRNQSEVVCVSVGDYKEKTYVDLRVFFQDPESDSLRPTKKGITIEHTMINELKTALIKADNEVRNNNSDTLKHQPNQTFTRRK